MRIINKLILSIGIPITYLSALWLRFVKKKEIEGISDKIFMNLGILPILDHYYQPLINPKKYLTKQLSEDRKLPGIDMNIDEQLGILSKFDFNKELLEIPIEKSDKFEYFYNNGSYESGDAEYLYNIIRTFKPKTIIEIGGGYSTLVVRKALVKNKENCDYDSRHICVEPFEQPWLASIEVELYREKVEKIDLSFFSKLEANDVLFIDSSHIIRPQGDVLFEYLELLPILKSGVLVHIHDVFTPKDYPDEWIFKHKLWNEQYLLEAFLSFNSEFRVVGALNYLAHNFHSALAKKCPIYAEQLSKEPGAFWIIKN